MLFFLSFFVFFFFFFGGGGGGDQGPGVEFDSTMLWFIWLHETGVNLSQMKRAETSIARWKRFSGILPTF